MLYLSTKSSQCIPLNGNMKSKVVFDIKGFLDYQDDESVQTATLSMPYAILCNSNYQMNYTNDRLDFLLGGVETRISFPYGNYGVDTFMQQFVTSMPSSFGITFNQVTGCFTITNSTAPFTLLSSSTMDYILGYSGDISGEFIGGVYTATMPRVANFLPTPFFRICVENNTLYNGQVLGINGSPAYSNVLASIPNVTKQNTQVVYQNFGDEFAIQPTGQTQLILSILDDNGNFIDFNGVSSYFQLRLRLYKKIKRTNKSFIDLVEAAARNRQALVEQPILEKPIDKILGPPL